MTRQILYTAVVLAAFVSRGFSEDLKTLIDKGRLTEVSDSLSERATASVRDGNTLYFRSLVESNGAESAQLMRAALDANVSTRYQEDIYLRLAQYYLINQNATKLMQITDEYRSKFSRGANRPLMARYAVVASELNKQLDSALTQADKFQIEYGKDENRQWGLIDQARILQESEKNIGVQKLIKKLSQERSGPGVPIALYIMTGQAIDANRGDNAALNYNLLREEYPSAIGLNALENRLGGTTDEPTESGEAEKVTGTMYWVKVGVFSSLSNAKEYARQFSVYKVPVDFENKQISGKSYQIVYVGKFRSFEDARKFKETLEAKFNETYQVVAR